MAKKLLALVLSVLMLVSLLPISALAADDLQTAFSSNDDASITLTENVTLTSTLVLDKAGKTLTVDLNGFNISIENDRAIHVKQGTLILKNTGTADADHGVITANKVGESSFKDSSSVIRVGNSGDVASLEIGAGVTVSSNHCYGVTVFGTNSGTYGQTLVVDGTVSVTGSACAISGNGTSTLSATSITINDGAVVTAENDNAIYNPQAGLLTINGGTITGTGGIESKAGSTIVEVNGNPTITATAPSATHSANNDGTSTSGYAIVAVNNSGYKGNASFSIKGGTITGPIGIANDTATEEEKKGSISISGGVFNTTSDLNDFLADGVIMAEVDGKYVVDEPNAGSGSEKALVVETKDGSGNLTGWVVSDGTNNVTIARSFPQGIYSHEITTAVIEALISDLLANNNDVADLAGVTYTSFALVPFEKSSEVTDGVYSYEVVPYMTVSNGGAVLAKAEIPAAAMSKDVDLEVVLQTTLKPGTPVKVVHAITPEESFETTVDADKKATVTTKSLSPFYVYPEYTWTVKNVDKNGATTTWGDVTVTGNSGTGYAVLGDTLTITPVKTTGYHLDNFSINEQPKDITAPYFLYTLTYGDVGLDDGDVDILATWRENTYKVTASYGANGTMTVDKPDADTGETVSLMIAPNTDYHLVNIAFTDDSDAPLDIAYTLSSDASTAKFTMPAKNVKAYATFGNDDYSVAVTVLPAEAVTAGCTVEAVPASSAVGDYFELNVSPAAGWELDGDIVVKRANNPKTDIPAEAGSYKMPADDVEVTATFKKIGYTVKVDPAAVNGTVTINGDTLTETTANVGDTITLTVAAAENYKIDSVSYTVGSDTYTFTGAPYEFKMPAGAVTVTATFATGVAKIGTTVYGTLRKAVEEANAGDKIVMIANTITDGTIKIEKNLTLDLNGKTVTTGGKRAFSVAGASGTAFTIEDNSAEKNGYVIGGDCGSDHGGVIYISGLNTFNLKGGTLTGGKATYGGGVFAGPSAIFVMSGGEITGNNATRGGGVYLGVNGEKKANVTIAGGKITGNTASYLGDGVYVSDTAEFEIKDSPVITGNTTSNVYLENVGLIKASSLGDAEIGVTLGTTDKVGAVTKGTSGAKYTKFTSDVDGLDVRNVSNEVTLCKVSEITATADHATAKIYVKAVGETEYVESAYAAQNDAVKVEFTADPGYKYKEVVTDPTALSNWDVTAAPTFTFTMGTDPVKVTATFVVKSYTVKFYENHEDVTGTMPDQSFDYDEEKALTANAFQLTGRSFVGWATSASGSKAYDDKATVKNLTNVDGGVFGLYAIWDDVEYPVVFMADGTQVGSTQDVAYKGHAVAPADPTKAGYTFAYWYLDNEAVEVKPADYEIIGDTTFNAKFKPITYTVAFHPNTGTGSTYNLSVDYESGVTAVKIEDTGITPVGGKSFMYWTRTEADSGTQYKNGGIPIDNLTTTAGDVVDLYAQWTGEGITITYHRTAIDGNADVTTEDNVTSGSLYTVKDYPTTAGWAINTIDYEFTGWNTKADGTGTPRGKGEQFNPTENTELFAQFKIKEYNITADPAIENGSVTTDPAAKAKIGATVTIIPSANPGYGVASVAYKIGDDSYPLTAPYEFKMPAANVTVTATFDPGMYNITADASSVIPAGTGTVTAPANAKTGENINIVVKANPGYEIDTIYYIMDDATESSTSSFQHQTEATWITAMPASNIKVMATFAAIPYTVKVDPAAVNGTVYIGTGTDTQVSGKFVGDPIALTVTAAENYNIGSVSYTVNGDTYVFPGEPYEFTMPAGNVTVKADFVTGVAKNTTTGYVGTLAQVVGAAAAGQTVELIAEAPITASIDVSKEITIDLAGHNIVVKDPANKAFKINAGGKLTLKDDTANPGMVDGKDAKKDASEGGLINVKTGGTLTLNGAILANGKSTDHGGAVNVQKDAEFVMLKGAIIDCDGTQRGGAVHVDAGGTFTMSGGAITGNSANNGGAVYLRSTSATNKANFTISNSAYITDNDAALGGGVYVEPSSNFIVEGNARIADSINGGNVYLAGSGATIKATGIDASAEKTIGVTHASGAGTVTSGSSAGSVKAFFSDNDKYIVRTEGGEVVLKEPKKITVTVTNGTYTLKVNDEETCYALSGDTVTLTITPDTGYEYSDDAGYKLVADKFTSWGGTAAAGYTGTMGGEDATVTVTFKPIVYNVTYNTNGGSAVAATTAPYGTVLSAPAETPTKGGYTFANWYLVDPDVNAFPYTIIGDVTFNAAWTPVKYTYTFNSNGGSDVAGDTVDYGTKVAQPADPTRTGYIFQNWYIVEGDTNVDVAWDYTIIGDVTFNALWKPIEFTVRYFANEGDGTSPVIKTVKYEDGTKALTVTEAGFSKSGSAFGGWNTMPGGTGVDVAAGADISTKCTTATTYDLYAQWNGSTFKVTYYRNDSDTDTSKYTYNSETYSYNAPASVKTYPAVVSAGGWTAVEHKTFKSWNTAPDGTGISYQPGATNCLMIEDIALYAIYDKDTYTVTFLADGSAFATDTVTYDSLVKEPVTKPTKDNYNFDTWYTDETYATPFNFATYHITDDTQIYAYFIGKDVNVTFKYQKDPAVADYEGKWKFGSAVDVPADPTWDGHGFNGWFDATTGGNRIIDFTKLDAGDHTVFAQWSTGEYNVNVTVSPSDGGTASASPVKANMGADITISYIPADGYEIKEVTFGGDTIAYSVDVDAKEITFKMPAKDVNAKVVLQKSGYAINTIEVEGGHVNVQATAAYGEWVTLAATADLGYTFDGYMKYTVKGAISGSTITVNDESKFQMPNEAVNVTATFTAQKQPITLTFDNTQGTLTADPDTGEQLTGQNVTLTVATEDGFTVDKFYYTIGSDATAYYLTAPDAVVKMPYGGIKVYATFTAGTYTINKDVNVGGVIDGLKSANTAQSVTMTVTANPGYEITSVYYIGEDATQASWTISSEAEKSVKSVTFNMPATNITMYATYKAIDYTVTLDPTTNLSADKTENVHVGDKVTVTVDTADKVLATLTVDGADYSTALDAESKFYFFMPAKDVTVAATFDEAIAVVTKGGNSVYYTNFDVALAAANGGTIKMLGNTTTACYEISGDVTLDLNGMTLTGTADNKPVFDVNGTFTLIDSVGGGKITSSADPVNARGAGVYVHAGKTFNMQGGEISGIKSSENGAGVYVEDNATFNVSGKVTVTGNTTNGKANNVYLAGTQMYVPAELDSASVIGVTTQDTGNVNVTKGTTDNGAKGYKCFISDDGIRLSRANGNQAMLYGRLEITIKVVGEGTVSTDPSGYAVSGDTVKVTLTPAEGYRIAKLPEVTHILGAVTDTGNGVYSFTMDTQAVEITATFTAIKYTVTKYEDADGNTITASKYDDITVGEEITLTVTPGTGYEVDLDTVAYVIGTDVRVVGSALKFNMPADNVGLTATFTKVPYTITPVSDHGVLDVVATANYMDEITVAITSAEAGYMLKAITVTYGTTPDTVPVTTTYKADNSFDQAVFYMPAGNATVTAEWTKIADIGDDATKDLLENAAALEIASFEYTGAAIPEGTTVNYYVQSYVIGADSANAIADLESFILALGKVASNPASLVVYKGVEYEFDGNKWVEKADNTKTLNDAIAANKADILAAGEIKFAVDGVPVTFTITVQDYLLSTALPKLGGDVVAIVGYYVNSADAEAVAKKFDQANFDDAFTFDPVSCIEFIAYVNNQPQDKVKLDSAVKLKIPYAPASNFSKLLVGVQHGTDDLSLIDADKTENKGDYLTAMADLFSKYIVAKPKSVPVTAEKNTGITFTADTSAYYNNPYTFTVTVDEPDYKLVKVLANGYELTADAASVAPVYSYTFIPQKGNSSYTLTAVVAIPVTYVRNYGMDGSDITYSITDDAIIGETYTVLGTDVFPPESSAYSFTVWNTDYEGKGTEHKAGESITDVPKGLTLYAQWDLATKYSITFDDGLEPWEALFVTIDDPSATDGYYVMNDVVPTEAVGAKIPEFARTYYTLQGWYFDKDYKYQFHEDKALNNADNVDNVNAYSKPGTEAGVRTLKLYAKWVEDIKQNQVTINSGVLTDATYGVYYRYTLSASYKSGANEYFVDRNFRLVTDATGDTVATEAVLPEGLHLNQLTGEIYGVPTAAVKTGDDLYYSFFVRMTTDDGNTWISPAKEIKIKINPLEVAMNYSVADAYKTFGDVEPPQYTFTSNLKEIDVAGAAVDGAVNANTNAYVTLNDSSAMSLKFEYSPTLPAYHIDPDGGVNAYKADPVTYDITVTTSRAPGEDAGYYNIYFVTADVKVGGTDVTSNFLFTPKADYAEATAAYQFQIKPKDIRLVKEYTITSDVTFTGKKITPTLEVKDELEIEIEGSKTIILEDKNGDPAPTGKSLYELTYGKNTYVTENDTANNVITVTGDGNYFGSFTFQLEIEKKSLKDDDVYVVFEDTIYYNGSRQMPTPTVTYNGMTLKKGNTGPAYDFNILDGPGDSGENTYVAGNDAHLNYIKLNALNPGNYKDFKIAEFTMVPAPLTATWNNNQAYSRKYDGTKDAPKVTSVATVYAGDTVDITAWTYSYYKVDGDTLAPLTDAPKDVGSYYAVVKDVDNKNYAVTEATLMFPYEITKRETTITSADAYKIYGDAEPDPLATYTITDDAIIAGDDVQVKLERVAGEPVGEYVINVYLIGNDAVNYEVTPVTGIFRIDPRPLKITADSNTKTYGEADPDPLATYTISRDATGEGIVNGDIVGVKLARTITDENVGTYDIDAYTLEGDADVTKNYVVTTFVNGTFTITPRDINGAAIVVDPAAVYYTGEDVTPTVTVKVTVSNVFGVDYELTADAAYIIWTDTNGASAAYAINADTYDIQVEGTGNFTGYATANDVFVILKTPVTIKADDKSKNYNAADPALTATVTYGQPVTASAAALVYTLNRDPGEAASTSYTINVTANADENPNYDITVQSGKLTIGASGGGGGGGGSIGGGGGGSANYKLILADTSDGTINFNDKNLKGKRSIEVVADKEIVMDVTPDKYFVIDKVTYTKKGSTEVTELKANDDGTYTIKMPKAEVTVTATFKPENDNDNNVGRKIIGSFTKGYSTCNGISCPMNRFVDLRYDAWYHDGIHYCLDNGIMQGFGNEYFKPDETTTRAQVVTVLWNIAGHPIAKSSLTFTDVNVDDWFYQPITWAAANGIVNGYGDGTFGPNDPITREQLAKILFGYAEFYNFDVTDFSDLAGYQGVNEISDWAVPYVQWAVGAGICCGEDGNDHVLAPLGSATRAELATMILNFCTKVALKDAKK